MKRKVSTQSTVNFILVSLSLLLCSSFSYSQSAANFAGVWKQDPAKSSDFYKSFDVQYSITQSPQIFTVKQTFTLKNSKENVIREYTYGLDGKVTNMEKNGGTEKELAQWSADKKILNTRSTRTYNSQEVGFTETYTLSEDGLVLIVQKSDIIAGALSVKLVFDKQK